MEVKRHSRIFEELKEVRNMQNQLLEKARAFAKTYSDTSTALNTLQEQIWAGTSCYEDREFVLEETLWFVGGELRKLLETHRELIPIIAEEFEELRWLLPKLRSVRQHDAENL